MRDIDDEKSKGAAATEPGESVFGRWYEICIGAQLDASWSEWFEGLEMHPCGKSWTLLCGHVADQAALLGILNKLCRLNLPLVSVNEIQEDKPRREAHAEGGE
jgi:hypothetical protein